MLKYTISRWYIFSDGSVWFMDNLLCLCDVRKGRSYVNANVYIFSISSNGQSYLKYYFLCHRSSPTKRFSQVLIPKSLFSIFIHQNTKITTGFNIHVILEERPKTLLKMFLIDVGRLTLPGCPQDVILEHIF